ncbi:MAG TPA: hypothetical protein VNZ52_15095 [Candidatus Thermoplasmatota archaeon]|nr:hypothetical protein [Candidatus Thermoplasmatota archaeon]
MVAPLDVNNLPQVEEFELPTGREYVFLGAVGFEDRGVAVLERLISTGVKVTGAIAITYVPHDERNRVADFRRMFGQLRLTPEEQKWIEYRRFDPESFGDQLAAADGLLRPDRPLIVDISAMSKFEIAVVLQELRNRDIEVVIAYTESARYYPTRSQFDLIRASEPESTPDFLTSEVNRIVTTTKLSSVVMQGYPVVCVAFPTFNHRELLALVSEVAPQKLIVLHCVPHLGEDGWRREAAAWINRTVAQYVSADELEDAEVSTFEYRDTLRVLESIYHRFSSSHRLVVAPTGSKLQAVAAWILKQAHPDVQMVYPVCSTHVSEYTDGARAVWKIELGRMGNFAGALDRHRKQQIYDLASKIADGLRDA